jgi:hypothetical protein
VEALGSGNSITGDEDICLHLFWQVANQTWNFAVTNDLDEMHLGRSSDHREADRRVA